MKQKLKIEIEITSENSELLLTLLDQLNKLGNAKPKIQTLTGAKKKGEDRPKDPPRLTENP